MPFGEPLEGYKIKPKSPSSPIYEEGLAAFRPKPKKKTTRRVGVTPSVPSYDPLAAYAAAQQQALEQQMAFQRKQEELERARQRLAFQSSIQQLRGEEEVGVGEFESQIRETGATAARARGETETGFRRRLPGVQREVTSRGLGLSGIREGVESRERDALLRALQGIEFGRTTKEDALRRAIEALRKRTGISVAGLEQQIKALG